MPLDSLLCYHNQIILLSYFLPKANAAFGPNEPHFNAYIILILMLSILITQFIVLIVIHCKTYPKGRAVLPLTEQQFGLPPTISDSIPTTSMEEPSRNWDDKPGGKSRRANSKQTKTGASNSKSTNSAKSGSMSESGKQFPKLPDDSTALSTLGMPSEQIAASRSKKGDSRREVLKNISVVRKTDTGSATGTASGTPSQDTKELVRVTQDKKIATIQTSQQSATLTDTSNTK